MLHLRDSLAKGSDLIKFLSSSSRFFGDTGESEIHKSLVFSCHNVISIALIFRFFCCFSSRFFRIVLRMLRWAAVRP